MSCCRTMSVIALAALLLAPALIEVGFAQGFRAPATERFFQVEATAGKVRHGKETVTGYVYNEYGYPAVNVKLVLESLDASGAVLDRTTVPLDRPIPPFGRTDFYSPVSVAGVKYAGWVLYYDWVKGGGSQ